MHRDEDKTAKALDYCMGHILPAYLGIIISVFLLLVLFGCKSESVKPEEIQLSALGANNEEDRCPYTGDIVGIGNVVGSDQAFGGSGLTMILVQPDEPDVPGMYVAAVGHKSDNFSIGDRVDACQTKILVRYRAGGEYETLFITRKRPGIEYADSEAKRLKECREEVDECNANVAALIKAIDKSKEK